MNIDVTNEIELIEAFNNSKATNINIASGVYHLKDTLFLNVSNVIIKGDEFDRPILDFSETPNGTNGLVIECDNIQVKNIIIRYAGYKGLFATTNNSTFENIDTYGNCDCGFQLKFSSNTKIISCCSYDNFGYMTMKDGTPIFGFNSDGFCDKQYEGPGNIWFNCKSWNNSDDGFDFYERITPEDSPTIIENCVAFSNGYEEKDISKNPRKDTDSSFFETCEYDLTKYPSYGNGNGFKLGGNFTKHCVITNNCYAFNNKRNGFAQNENIGKMDVNKCVSSGNGLYNYGFRTYAGKVTISNCITTKGEDSIITTDLTFKNS